MNTGLYLEFVTGEVSWHGKTTFVFWQEMFWDLIPLEGKCVRDRLLEISLCHSGTFAGRFDCKKRWVEKTLLGNELTAPISVVHVRRAVVYQCPHDFGDQCRVFLRQCQKSFRLKKTISYGKKQVATYSYHGVGIQANKLDGFFFEFAHVVQIRMCEMLANSLGSKSMSHCLKHSW